MNARCSQALLGLALLNASMLAIGASPPTAATAPAESAVMSSSNVEEIYVLRSLREEASAPGAFCAPTKTGFKALNQSRFSFWAVLTQAPDGRVIDTHTHRAGLLNGCFETVTAEAEGGFYAEAEFGGIRATGHGKCTPIARDLPEPGIASVRCFLILSNLPSPYVSGVLATNTVVSRNSIGEHSDPAGYTQPSIATVRLWRRR